MLLRTSVVVGLIIAGWHAALAQIAADVSLYGKVTHSTAPETRTGDRVLAYSIARKTWVGPALTDTTGAYYFYRLDSGSYIVRVYVDGKSVWANQVTVHGPTRYDIAVTP